MKEPKTGRFFPRVSLSVNVGDLEFIFQEVSHLEYTVTLTQQ